MASYIDLYKAYSNDELRNRIQVASIILAEQIRLEDPATGNHSNRLSWAKACLENPEAEAKRMLWAYLSYQSAAEITAITGAEDGEILAVVQKIVSIFAVAKG